MENGTEDTSSYPEEMEAARSKFDPIMASAPKKLERLSQTDVLRSKVLGLELEKWSLEVTMMKQQLTMVTLQLAERDRARNEILARADVLVAECLSRYGIDIRTGKINDDGTFSPFAK